MSDDKTEKLRDDAALFGPGETDAEFDVPFKSPVKPIKLSLDDTIQFNCHKGIACFNECCRSINIQLTPYDILRLKNRLNMTSSEFVARHTLPFEMDGHGLPGLKLATKPGTTECVFLTEEGCSVYEDRPAACRYYALGSMGMRKVGTSEVEDVFFLVKEPHCLGHNEPKTQTVREYRKEQGIEPYDDMNREWRDIVIKKRTGGPALGQPTARSMQLFDMCSYDLDNFREFIQTQGFQDVFDVDAETMERLKTDDEELLRFAYRFIKQALFGEKTIALKGDARDKRLVRRRELTEKQKEKMRVEAEKEDSSK